MFPINNRLPPGHVAHTVSAPLLVDLLETCRDLCPQCYAGPERMCHNGTDALARGGAYSCKACGYAGPAGDWRLGWLCHTLRNAVTEKFRAETLQAQLVQAVQAQCPTCAANLAYLNGGPMPEHLRNENVNHVGEPVNTGRNDGAGISMRMPRSETIQLCSANVTTGEHMWRSMGHGAMHQHCICGARRPVPKPTMGRMQCTKPNILEVPRSAAVPFTPRGQGAMYMHHYHEGNTYMTPMPMQGEGNIHGTCSAQGEGSTHDNPGGSLGDTCGDSTQGT